VESWGSEGVGTEGTEELRSSGGLSDCGPALDPKAREGTEGKFSITLLVKLGGVGGTRDTPVLSPTIFTNSGSLSR